jgi:hypothetical protein
MLESIWRNLGMQIQKLDSFVAAQGLIHTKIVDKARFTAGW